MDILNDNGYRVWYQLGTKYAEVIPDYVMDYKLPDEKEASAFDKNLFADSFRRLFPINDPASTWLSAAYFAKRAAANELKYTADEAEHIKSILLKAAEIFNIKSDIEKISSVIVDDSTTEITKKASDDDNNFGLIMQADDGTVVAKKYPMFDKEGVARAADYFSYYRTRYPLHIRRSIAKNIMSKAAEYGMDVDSLHYSVKSEAGYGIPQRHVVMDEILRRSKLTKNAEDAAVLANINQMLNEVASMELDSQTLDKLAEVLDTFDRSAGLVSEYNKTLRIPTDFLFEIPLDMAKKAMEDAVELDKFVFSIEKLAELDVDVFDTVLGEEVTKDIKTDGKLNTEKMAEVLPALPRPDRAALEEKIVSMFC